MKTNVKRKKQEMEPKPPQTKDRSSPSSETSVIVLESWAKLRRLHTQGKGRYKGQIVGDNVRLNSLNLVEEMDTQSSLLPAVLTTLTKSWKVMAEVLRSCARSARMSRLLGVTSSTNSGVLSTSTKSSHGISPNPSGSYCNSTREDEEAENDVEDGREDKTEEREESIASFKRIYIDYFSL